MSVISKKFGNCCGVEIAEYIMENSNGMKVSVLDRGGIIRNLFVPDKNNNPTDVVTALFDADAYEINEGYMGSAIGRYSNRIEKGEFEINGVKYNIGINNGNNALHGGFVGYDKKTWGVEISDNSDEPELKLSLVSPDGEEGFPGNLDILMTYKLTNDNSIVINYKATTDKDTIINLTNHTYFNLSGHDSGVIDDQILKLNCSFYTPNTNECLPNGQILTVSNTAFDFTTPKTFKEAFESKDEQIAMFGGIDHNMIIDGEGYRCFAVAESLTSGICMECWTDKPGVQLYTANVLDEPKGKDGAEYGTHAAFCLETQFYPNSMKYKHFPSPVLKAGEEYNYTTAYKFYTK